MNKVKQELSEVLERVRSLEAERDQAVEALQLGQESWAASEANLRAEQTEMLQRLADLDTQNGLLHEQLQQLGLKVAVVQSQVSTATYN